MRADVLDADQAAALGGLVLDDDVAELAGIVQPRQDVDGVLELLVLRRRRHADLAGRDLLALLLDGVDHVLRHQTEGIELLRVHPDPHRILAGAHHRDVADAGQARQLVDQVDRRVVPHEEAVVLAVRRIQRHESAGSTVIFFWTLTPCACTASRQLGQRVAAPGSAPAPGRYSGRCRSRTSPSACRCRHRRWSTACRACRSTPLTCSSIGRAIVSITVWALAPG